MTPRRTAAGRRNILLIVADQLRADALGCYGNPITRTPHLDALAARGARFAEHFSVTAPCGPARASLLTGVHQSVHRVMDNSTVADDRLPTLAIQLAASGVSSHVVGYTDTVRSGPDSSYEAVPPGFTWHTRFNLNPPGLASWIEHLNRNGYSVPDDPMNILRPVRGTANLAGFPAKLSDTAYIADRTIACMAGLADEPWLILATFLRPHPPWVAPAPYHGMYDPALTAPPLRASTRELEAARHPFLRSWLARRVPDTAPEDLTDEAVAAHRATYAGLVTELDHQVGRVLAALCDLGRAEDTLVVFTSDHGDSLGDHWSLGTGGFRETAYRVPLIIAAPEQSAPVSTTLPTESVDIAPTVLEWAGAPALPWSSGRSLLPVMADDDRRAGRRRTAAVCEFDFSHIGDDEDSAQADVPASARNLAVLRGSRFTYVHFPEQRPLLFDRLNDPGESRDLAAAPEYRCVVSDCARRLLDHRMSCADPSRPLPSPKPQQTGPPVESGPPPATTAPGSRS
ncbi:sulfatase-like hydrolase/transferase [Streptomyces sp. NPDC006458]|uniref:sulfatase-like hydrolase/transferase n=1 Tax=Streptomyces sp. NPDC006458 TaxID=3154302 RepID=UPI0033B67A79